MILIGRVFVVGSPGVNIIMFFSDDRKIETNLCNSHTQRTK